MAESTIDEDARLVKETFSLPEAVETLAPVVITNQILRKYLVEDGVEGYTEAVRQAADAVGQERDIVVMEGSANFREGYIVGLSPVQTIALLDAKVVTVVGYNNGLQVVDDILTAKFRMGDRLAGVVINAVPASRTDYVENLVAPYLDKQKISLLAVLPYQKFLRSISINEIVDVLDAELLCDGCYDELVENLLVASMSVEHAINYFRRVTNKAVIVGGDRPDVQLAALETSTKALILTGNLRPNPMILAKADDQGVAIVLSQYDTLTTVEKVEQFFGKTRFQQAEKMTRFEKLLGETMDFDTLYQAIGLKK
jgi:BioD-like phosphotransacetylase family protein